MKKGTVKKWISDRGYGFIETKKLNDRVFVHRSDLVGAAYLQEGEKVQFEIEETKQGPKATNVKPIFLSVF
ncbi:MAG: cold shock domain-containing protein [Candidatus Bathyarchaeota archaeon]|nr:cold shock domain-containing protein [Candidatus Bathyarchaeum tardum]WGM90265.1 MAG: cold shock domain-containing protein [Candidatus Bathyarchaeum tardum]WNZ29654.1 MAG: cold shock domain-containing protein [Candidatus Bathyarchaeota archaeon]